MVNGNHRYPCQFAMTVFADVGRIDVRRVLARRIRAVMAADASAGYPGMVKVRRDPGDCRMAIITIVPACDVRRMLAGCCRAVMAGSAGTGYLGVIDRVGWHPYRVVVAIFADIGRIDVRRVLAGRIRAVVAAEAVTGDVGMVEPSRNPDRRLMTIVAGVTGRYVIRRLSCCDYAIVTGSAASGYSRMIHERNRIPCSSGMAVRADLGSLYMVCWLGRGSHKALG